ncbi:MAG TPA: hypothetical protein VJZ04_12110 [Lachnospiraceae bacterium]|nr:hypothetical protein [Lachnospiraceae bacterium]
MSDLNHLELQNLRHLIGGNDNSSQKLDTYAKETKDPQVKSFFEQSAKDAKETKEKLMTFLQ